MQVRFEAWNAFQLPDLGNLVLGSARAPRRADLAIDYLRDCGAEVIALCEVNGTQGRRILDAVREQYPHQTPRLGDPGSGRLHGTTGALPWIFGGGIAIVSTHPIASVHQYAYRNYSVLGPDAIVDKGIVAARITKDDQQFWIVATHTQADDTVNDALAQTHAIRMRQADELRAFVDTIAADGAPVIYGGDFNVEYIAGAERRDHQGRNEFEQLAVRSGIRFADPTGHPLTYDGAHNPLIHPAGHRDTLDYIGTTGTATVAELSVPQFDGEPPSDHNPVAALIDIAPFDGPVTRNRADPAALESRFVDRVAYPIRDAAGVLRRLLSRSGMIAQ